MQDSIENIQPEELNGDATSPITSVETSADDEQKQLSDIDNSAESAESSTVEKKKEAKKPLVKKFDLYIIKKFIGTFFFIILMLLLVIVMFDINEKLDAMLLAPLKETVFKYFLNFLPGFINQFAPMFVFITVIFFTSKLADR
ncbi:MAG: LptF/LptG family permease, partial [Sodaliphilus sp.]|nr:LptF/LptG family permease [Sodaliphilus sp.]